MPDLELRDHHGLRRDRRVVHPFINAHPFINKANVFTARSHRHR
jgi:hypothetical protein